MWFNKDKKEVKVLPKINFPLTIDVVNQIRVLYWKVNEIDIKNMQCNTDDLINELLDCFDSVVDYNKEWLQHIKDNLIATDRDYSLYTKEDIMKFVDIRNRMRLNLQYKYYIYKFNEYKNVSPSDILYLITTKISSWYPTIDFTDTKLIPIMKEGWNK